MRKLMLVLVCALAVFNSYAIRGIDFGLKGGINFSGLWDNDAHGSEGKFGYQLGVTAEHKFSNGFAFAPEFVFTSQGTKWNKCDYINYLSFPLMFKYYPQSNFSLNFGPEFDFCVHSTSGLAETFNFGLAVGASYFIDRNIYLDARYSMGLTDVYQHGNAKSYNISVGVGYKF